MMTTVLIVAALSAAAFLAGAVNAVAGGGTLITFPLLSLVVPSVRANATSTVALVPGSVAGAFGLREELRPSRRWLLLLAGPSFLGGLLGSVLLVVGDDRSFDAVVPWLLLTATLLFLAQPALTRRFATPGHPPAAVQAGAIVFQFLVAVYGGYFGAGIGILMLSSLGLMGVGDIHRMNALKNALAGAINAISVVVFVSAGKVEWRFALPMAAAGILGGYAGARVGRKLPKRLVRGFVVAVGLLVSVYAFAKQAGLLSGTALAPTMTPD